MRSLAISYKPAGLVTVAPHAARRWSPAHRPARRATAASLRHAALPDRDLAFAVALGRRLRARGDGGDTVEQCRLRPVETLVEHRAGIEVDPARLAPRQLAVRGDLDRRHLKAERRAAPGGEQDRGRPRR